MHPGLGGETTSVLQSDSQVCYLLDLARKGRFHRGIESDFSGLSVVFFNQLSGACSTWKMVKILFFSCFQPFLFIFILFRWFHAWNQQKVSEMNKKHIFFNFCHSSKLVAKAGQLLEGYLKIIYLGWFFYFFQFFCQFLTDVTQTS